MSSADENRRPDVEIACSVRARELRFKTVPRTKVWFEGAPEASSRVRSERENLPDEVTPGVTYRDVWVRWHAQARIAHPTDPGLPPP